MTFKELQTIARDARSQHPDLGPELCDILAMARDEINDGGSEDHECTLANDSITALLQKTAS